MTEDTRNSEVAPSPEETPGSPELDLAGQEDEFESFLLDEGQETAVTADGNEGTKVTAGTDEDFGITLSDDDLWDAEGSNDGIPLFDELALEIGEAETAQTVPLVSGGNESAAEAAAGDTPVSAGNGLDTATEAVSAITQEEGIKQEEDLSSLVAASWIPWGVTGMSALMLILGIFVLWNLASTAGQVDLGRSGTSFQTSQQERGTMLVGRSDGAASAPAPVTLGAPETLRDMDRISLAPFLIPAQRGGEMVFLKLQVELTVASTTKHGLLKKEAWVRDAIYRELKGIDVSSGDAGNFLLQYRRPLLERLDRELAPLTIEDIRLAGFLMK